MIEQEFQLLSEIKANPGSRDALRNAACKQLSEKGWITPDGFLSDAGEEALEPYRVDNAIIMAAGVSSRFIPLSYEIPKGLLLVKGEVLIERMIRQLQEKGIGEIHVIVGYMQDKFLYLKDKFGVTIHVNKEYAAKNNPSSLMLVTEHLKNSYILCSDLYYTRNVFSPYVYDSYYAMKMFYGEANEYAYKTDKNKRIISISAPCKNELILAAEAYFSGKFSGQFKRILCEEYAAPGVAEQIWEVILQRHLDDLAIHEKIYTDDVVYEFDKLEELRVFDPSYLNNIGSPIFEHICSVLQCVEKDIVNIEPIKTGLTNQTFKFTINGKPYLYRHPGAGTAGFLNRRCEQFAEEHARRLGIDSTYIYMDPDSGWKVSEFVDGCADLDIARPADLQRALSVLRKLHDAAIPCRWEFEPLEQARLFIEDMHARGQRNKADFADTHEKIVSLYALVSRNERKRVLSHNDAWSYNFLATGKNIQLIDWEYSGNNDPLADLASFLTNVPYSYAQAADVLKTYLNRQYTDEELTQFIGYNCIISYYWYIWAVWKSTLGHDVGDVLPLWHEKTRVCREEAMALYQGK
ncbi:choline kinase [Deltaproteobacteria bacterium]|nr:choline kinase [Deltaproteobacteria bacterium]